MNKSIRITFSIIARFTLVVLHRWCLAGEIFVPQTETTGPISASRSTMLRHGLFFFLSFCIREGRKPNLKATIHLGEITDGTEASFMSVCEEFCYLAVICYVVKFFDDSDFVSVEAGSLVMLFPLDYLYSKLSCNNFKFNLYNAFANTHLSCHAELL